jgi:hypothetical protein
MNDYTSQINEQTNRFSIKPVTALYMAIVADTVSLNGLGIPYCSERYCEFRAAPFLMGKERAAENFEK